MTKRTRHQRGFVALVAFAFAVALVGGATGCTSTAPAHHPASPPPAAVVVDHDLAHVLALPGDQVVTVPDGTYTGTSVTAPHAETSGRYRGWLVLVAQSRHHVVVDLSRGPLVLDTGTSRVLFVGFTFINGIVIQRGDDVAFWYTEHTFPIEEWDAQYRAAGGNAAALRTMPNGVPKTLWIGEETSHTVLRTKLLGADIHDVGDDGVFVDHSSGAEIRGTRIWNIDVKGYDPGFNPWNPTLKELIHNDSVQIPGSVTDLTMTDSSVSQTITVGGDNANAADLVWDNVWITGSNSVGMDFGVQYGHRITGSITDVRAWGNGRQHPHDPGYDQLRVDFVDGRESIWPRPAGSPRLQVASLGTNLNQQPPTGLTISTNRDDDIRAALDDDRNPANVWRSAHPYTSWPAYFHFPKPARGQ